MINDFTVINNKVDLKYAQDTNHIWNLSGSNQTCRFSQGNI